MKIKDWDKFTDILFLIAAIVQTVIFMVVMIWKMITLI